MFLFEEQEDTYSCGAYAFRNACALMGIKKSIAECKKLCNTVSYQKAIKKHFKASNVLRHPIKMISNIISAPGTSEEDIYKAVKKVNLKPEFVDIDDEGKCYKYLFRKANRDIPVILAVNYFKEINDSGHWLCCTGIQDDRFVIIDSAPLSGKVLQLQSWDKLRKRFIWNDGEVEYFECIGITLRK